MTSPSMPNGCSPGSGDNQEPRSEREAQPCAVCRTAARAGDKFCPECGRRISESPIAPPPAEIEEVQPGAEPLKNGPPAQPQDQPPKQASVPPPVTPVEPEVKPAAPPPEPKKCTCGQALPPEACFCLTCGAQVGKPKPRRRLVRRKNGSPELAAEMNGGELTVGKAPDCSLAVTGDDYLSRRHARLYEDDGMVFLEDLGSSNGTFLRVHRPILLEPGDEILVGTTVLRFEQD